MCDLIANKGRKKEATGFVENLRIRGMIRKYEPETAISVHRLTDFSKFFMAGIRN
jgi:hypothetical protein